MVRKESVRKESEERREIWVLVFVPNKEDAHLYLVHGNHYDEYDEDNAPYSEEVRLAFIIRRHADGKFAAFNLDFTQMTHAEFRILLRRVDHTQVFIDNYPDVAEDFGMISISKPVVLFMPN